MDAVLETVYKKCPGVFFPVNVNRLDGTKTSIAFVEKDGKKGMIVRRELDDRIVDAIKSQARWSRINLKKGHLLRNTQNHVLPYARVPRLVWEGWKDEVGAKTDSDPHLQEVAARKLSSSEFQDLRMSEYRS